MSFTIHTPDALRTMVEATSGGKQTVLYTPNGSPNIMNVIPRFNFEDINTTLGSGLHPAFKVNDKIKSEIFVATYQGYENEYGELCSLPNMAPVTSKSFNEMSLMMKKSGTGWHIMTNAERSALLLWIWRNGAHPGGNTNYGRDGFLTFQTAIRADKGEPGIADTGGVSLTGSCGQQFWRHDNTPFGISDLCGNLDEYISGIRLSNGEIQLLKDNDAADVANLLLDTNWKCILENGSFTDIFDLNSIKYDSTVPGDTANCADPILSKSITNYNGIVGDSTDITPGYVAVAFQDMTNNLTSVPLILKQLCLAPFTHIGLNGNTINIKNYGDRVATFGGNYTDGYPSAGVFKLSFMQSVNSATITTGARPCFVNL